MDLVQISKIIGLYLYKICVWLYENRANHINFPRNILYKDYFPLLSVCCLSSFMYCIIDFKSFNFSPFPSVDGGEVDPFE